MKVLSYSKKKYDKKFRWSDESVERVWIIVQYVVRRVPIIRMDELARRFHISEVKILTVSIISELVNIFKASTITIFPVPASELAAK